jgi:BirA family transcriptional regulator, biotin operon repressor / biotin---[acetyl-CoA-carboxylase] ligase
MKQKNDLIHLDSIDSTNNYLKNICSASSVKEGTVILADYQNEGKGQGFNKWHSKKGENLLVSILFKPMLRANQHFALSEFITLGIIDTLSDYGINSKVKWPNDIYVGDQKIAGILVENSLMGEDIFQTIAGIGLNVNEEEFPDYLPNPVSMKMILKKDIDKSLFLDKLIKNMFIRYNSIKESRITKLNIEFNALLYKKDVSSKFISNDVPFKAIIVGVAEMGELLLKDEKGIKPYLFGEVQMIIE